MLLDALRVDSKELPRALQMIKDGLSRETDTAALPAAARLELHAVKAAPAYGDSHGLCRTCRRRKRRARPKRPCFSGGCTCRAMA